MSSPIRNYIKHTANCIALCIAALPGLICWIEKHAGNQAESIFGFWSHCFAMLPGHPGVYLRRAFYRLTLDFCSSDCFIGFGTFLTHRKAIVGSSAYIGSYSLIGSAHIGSGALIGSRVSILSGTELHELDSQGRWSSADLSKLRQVKISPHTWIGEGAIIMTDIGEGSLVASGSVVSTAVPPHILVAGNPARFVRNLSSSNDHSKQPNNRESS
jgi:virginiamycin A acetyltransferase